MNQSLVKAYLDGCQILFRLAPRFKLNQRIVEDHLHIKQKDAHVFRGYYDIDYFDDERIKYLVHVLPRTSKHKDKIQLGYYSLKDKNLVIFDSSSAWCWQQGSRLRWYDTKHVIFNDARDNDYISRIVDVSSKKTTNVISRALYDIDANREIGLSLNFSRLQRLRPGYGYSAFDDSTVGRVSLDDDGIFKCDLNNNKTKLLLSLEKLKGVSDCDLTGEDYVNHICFSPSGNRFIFFYIVTEPGKRNTVHLMVSDIDGVNVKVLEKEVQTSHYTWLDDTHLLTTYIDFKNKAKQGYRLYDVEKGGFSQFGAESLILDGHPTFFAPRKIITDTYPQKNRFNNQYLLIYDEEKQEKRQVGRFYHDAHFVGEQRCDLHPSLSEDYISVDTSCDGLRSVFLMKVKIG